MRKFALLVTVLLVFALAAWSQQPASGDAQGSSSSQGSMSSQQSAPSTESQGTAHHGHMAKAGGPAHVTGCLSGPNAEGAYELTSGKHKVEVGGNDELKNHVGHKVTVTGEWASGADIGENQAAEKNEKGEKAEKHLKATSIKMVSESCAKAAASSKKSY